MNTYQRHAILYFAFSLLLALITLNTCFSQNYTEINGRVIDCKSKSVLSYAHIGIKNSAIGTVSNERGEFRFIVPHNLRYDTLIVSYLGYRTYQSRISILEKSSNICLEEAPVILRDVTINAERLRADEILFKAAERLLQNTGYPNSDFKLEGFYREVQTSNSKTVSLIEAAFNVYDNLTTHPITGLEVNEFRKIFHESQIPDNKLYNHNNLLRLFGISTNFVVLAKQGLKAGKTTWAVGKRPYEIAEVSVYNDREVYVLTHDNDHVSLKIIIDANNFSILRNEYHSKQAPDNFPDYFWKYRRDQLNCGFYETHQVYDYREFMGKMYPNFFYRNDFLKCFDITGTRVENESNVSYQALISNIELNHKRPPSFKDLNKHKGMQQLDFTYHPEFWKKYNTIKDLPLDPSIVKELGGIEGLEEKFDH